MRPLRQTAIVCSLAKRLRDEGSWCGETHLQKAAYFMKELLEVPIESDFILYKHGPFSFDFREVLNTMRATGFLKLVPESYYGPRLEVTEAGETLMKKFPKTLGRYGPRIDFVAAELGSDGVATLERLATAFYVSRTWSELELDERMDKMAELKPHISLDQAEAAFERLERIEREAEKVLASAA